MKYISLFLSICIFLLSSNFVHAEDSLTIKQQIDRITQEVKDLNKAVFNKSFNNDQIFSTEKNDDTERFTSIDIRIYDLEKDIKNLTLQFEEIIFKLDDMANNLISLETDLNKKLKKIETESNLLNKDVVKKENSKVSQANEENTLGKIVISNNDQLSNDLDEISKSEDKEENTPDQNINNLTPEEQLQFALNQMMKKNYKDSKKILEQFILNFPDNSLSGSAHFWLGKIYLFQSNYRKAAIVFGEGVQKFPKSIKAAEMYYELVKSLKEMDKISEACKTLSLLEANYKGNKFTKDPEKIKAKLNCQNNN